MNIDYKLNTPLEAEQVAAVFAESEIRRPFQDLERIQAMINGANLTITAWDNTTLIGIARALTDFSYCCYLSDLAVHKDYQKQGIGKTLITKVEKEIGEETALILLSAPNAMEYYPKAGFTKAENAFLIPRKK